MPRPSIDLSNQRFYKWVILPFVKDGRPLKWKARCDCGTVKWICGLDAKRGRTKSCGCAMHPTGEANHLYKHGKSLLKGKDQFNYKKDLRLKRQFGISLERYNEMLEEQDGTCAICNKPETMVRKGSLCDLAVDHCHTTGAVRGLLCSQCNTGLGSFKDNLSSLNKAIEYLEKSNAV